MKTFIYFLVIIICVVSCKRDDENLINKEEIIIGDIANMKVNNYDTVLVGIDRSTQSFELNINNDWSNDFRFEIKRSSALGAWFSPLSRIICLNNNCLLSGYIKNDTTYLNEIISITTDTNGLVEVYKSIKYSCEKLSDEDSVTGVSPKFVLLPLNENDTLKKSGYFQSAAVTMSGGNSGNNPYIQHIQDTIFYRSFNTYDECDNLPDGEIIYIGIKFNSEFDSTLIASPEQEKLGWIKIILNNSNEISIIESAIQE